MIRLQRYWNFVPLALVTLFLASPVAADWLITHDGHRVETRGAWRIEGNLILFEQPTGRLVSMRLSEVDLEASQKATAEAAAAAQGAAEGEPEEPRESVYRLTDADVGHVRDSPELPPEDEAEAAGGSATSGGSLTVTGWTDESQPDDDGVLIVGTLANQSADTISNLRLVIRLYDLEGSFIASAEADLPTRALAPGGSLSFETPFPGVFAYSAVRFEPEGVSLVTAEPELPGAAEEDFDEDAA